ncbi:hypothetical protein SASPL_147689 [Salvia splendens]|uniref:Sec20 C-terminal domain-containing protein n=1 Tax=Salvia splendens TaxID=180675 RepID=A0A8X8Z618_SALSN|nr:hypothetical protein SASPL_147689 [Salvia splendens]
MDKVAEEVEKVKKEYQVTFDQTVDHIDAIQNYGKTSRISDQIEIDEAEKKDSLPRLNGLAQDGLNMLQSLQFNLDLLAPQLPSADDAEKAQSLAQSWKNQIQSLRLTLRNANLQAKANMKKSAQQERELLLGGGEESTARRRNLQTKAGMTSAAESITESLRRTRQLMVQEVERSASTIMTFEESSGVLKKAESEYKGHRVILITGFVIFSLAVLYVVSKRIGVLKLQRQVIAAVKAGMAGREVIAPPPIVGGRDGVNVVPVHQNMAPDLNVPLEQVRHDEL